MKITKDSQGNQLTLALEGRLDTITASSLETEVKASLDGVTKLTFDLTELAYISSAGLRVLLSAQKQMNKQGSMVITGANESIIEIFEVTGFIDILTVE